MCPYSLSASNVLQYHVCRLSDHGCQFDQLIAYLQQNQQQLSAQLPAENTLTVWSGQRLKIAGIGIAWQESFSGTDSFRKGAAFRDTRIFAGWQLPGADRPDITGCMQPEAMIFTCQACARKLCLYLADMQPKAIFFICLILQGNKCCMAHSPHHAAG